MNFRAIKRQRVDSGIPSSFAPRRVARPIEKKIWAVPISETIAGTQQDETFFTCTYPVTITGLRWDLSFLATAGTAPATYAWAIVRVPSGSSVETMDYNSGTFYSDEANVLSWGIGLLCPSDTPDTARYTSSTKAMRKMKGGDTLHFIYVGEATNTVGIAGGIQWFEKS